MTSLTQHLCSSLLLLLALGANPSVAGSLHIVEMPDGTTLAGVKQLEGMLPSETLSILELTLDKSTLADVQNMLGQAKKVPHKYDPHTAETVCYSSETKPKIYLLFSAGWPENPTEYIQSFSLSSRPSNAKAPCTASAKLDMRSSTANALKLGLTQSEVTSILGSPSKATPDWLVYSFEKYREYSPAERKKMPKAPGDGEYKGEYTYHVFMAHFTNGKMDLLDVWIGGETSW